MFSSPRTDPRSSPYPYPPNYIFFIFQQKNPHKTEIETNERPVRQGLAGERGRRKQIK